MHEQRATPNAIRKNWPNDGIADTIEASASIYPFDPMIVTELQRHDTKAPAWDTVGIHSCDFRPHFDGDFHSVFTTLSPLHSKSETETQFKVVAWQIAYWSVEHKTWFADRDRFQIVVGWPLDVRPTGRQCTTNGGTFDDLRRLVNDRTLISIRKGWHNYVFEAEIANSNKNAPESQSREQMNFDLTVTPNQQLP